MTKLEELQNLETEEEVVEWLQYFATDVCNTMALKAEIATYLNSES